MLKKLCLLTIILFILSGIGMTLAAPPVVHWRLDESFGEVAMDSGGVNHGEVIGDVRWQPDEGVFGGAALFTGHANSIRVSSDTWPFTFRDFPFTIMLWFRMEEDASGRSTLVTHAADNIQYYSIDVNDGVTTLKTNDWSTTDHGGVESSGGPDVNDGDWHHVCVVYSHRNAFILYVDGEDVGTYNQDRPLVRAKRFAIGALDRPEVNILGYSFTGSIDDAAIFDEALDSDAINDAILHGVNPAGRAKNLLPEDGATNVSRDTVLQWTAGDYAASHNVYLGTSLEDVKNASVDQPLGILVAPALTAASFEPERLTFKQTYYWRVDEVNTLRDPAVVQGSVWRFTTEGQASVVTPVDAKASSKSVGMGPEKTIDGSGLDDMDQHDTKRQNMWATATFDKKPWIQYTFGLPQVLEEMWVWNSNQSLEKVLGQGAKEVTIDTSLDGEDWTPLADVPEFARAPGKPGYSHNTVVNFAGVIARHVKLNIQDNWGTRKQVGLGEVRFLAIPVYASQPQPAEGAVDQLPELALRWRSGRESAQSELFLGTDPNALTFEDNTSDESLTVSLNLAQTYYWRVDEVNETESTQRWPGEVWQFSTAPYLSIDDMESYEDAEFKEIWATWSDGYQDSGNGALIGNGPTGRPETQIVYDGKQSMPYHYGQEGALVSETTRQFGPAMDWSQHGVQSLSLKFHGKPTNNVGQLYVSINGNRIADYPGPVTDMGQAQWHEWRIDLVSLGITVVDSLTLGIQGGMGTLYVDTIRLYPTHSPQYH